MLWFPTVVTNQTRWQRPIWWYRLPLTLFFLQQALPPFERGVPQQGMILVACEGELGYLATALVLTGDTKHWEKQTWWIGLDLPCCARHVERKIKVRVRRLQRSLKKGLSILPPSLPSGTIIQAHPQCPACTRLLKASLARHRFGPLVL